MCVCCALPTGTIYTPRGPLTPGLGQILVTLKSGLPYDDWKIVDLAKAAGYQVNDKRDRKGGVGEL